MHMYDGFFDYVTLQRMSKRELVELAAHKQRQLEDAIDIMNKAMDVVDLAGEKNTELAVENKKLKRKINRRRLSKSPA